MVGKLRQGLGRANPDAHHETQPIPNPGTDLAPKIVQGGEAREVQKTLVDGIDLQAGGELPQDFYDPIA